uniref:ADAM metallopeptidase domain 8 n=1 Tax=Amazona collaria TaxID=241587 RepID=A0A8B9GB69_9PSIT
MGLAPGTAGFPLLWDPAVHSLLHTSPLCWRQDHCFYQGHVQGHTNSAVSISTCGGLSGFFQVNGTMFLLEPLEEDAAGLHAVYRAAHLRGKRGTCRDKLQSWAPLCAHFPLPFQKSTPLHKGPRYVELVLVVDNEEVSRTGDNAACLLPQLYQPLRLRVALIGLEVWSYKDKIVVSPNPEVTLDNFLHWREAELLRRKPHDNAQLITGIDFHGTTVGLAKKLVMCTRDSGGVNQDHSTNPIGAASTMAHEMGHNLGMSHDEDVAGCRCPVPKADGGCVMAASVGLVYPKLFSRCSEQDMWQFLGDPRTSCLLNVPRADELYGGPVCGNQFVERGEQCDCGVPEECSDNCCNATTCQLREGAECARGECCQDCKVRAAGVLCRASKNDCDLPEHCTGLSAECPEDVFQENGISCHNGNGYCYNGACPSHGEQCRALWGAGTSSSPSSPHVPGDVLEPRLTRPSSDANEVVNPMGTQGSLRVPPVYSQVCYGGRCQNLLVYGNKNCSAKCNNHGVCNHKRECHCEPGWAAPYCEHQVSGMAAGMEPPLRGGHQLPSRVQGLAPSAWWWRLCWLCWRSAASCCAAASCSSEAGDQSTSRKGTSLPPALPHGGAELGGSEAAPHRPCAPQEELRPGQPAVPGGRPPAAPPAAVLPPRHRPPQPAQQHGGPAGGTGPWALPPGPRGEGRGCSTGRPGGAGGRAGSHPASCAPAAAGSGVPGDSSSVSRTAPAGKHLVVRRLPPGWQPRVCGAHLWRGPGGDGYGGGTVLCPCHRLNPSLVPRQRTLCSAWRRLLKGRP